MEYLIGIDVGSSSVKTGLFNVQGDMLALAINEYELIHRGHDLVEIDAQTFWDKLKAGVQEVLSSAGARSVDVKAMAVSSQGETFVPLAEDGSPLRPAIFWLDGRSSKQVDLISRTFGREAAYHVTGQPEIVPIWTASKILWLRQNEPDVFKRAHKYLLVEDYLIFRLTGRYVGEFSLYPSSMLFDIRRKCWWPEMLEYLGIRPDQLVELTESGEPVGPLTDPAAAELGLSTDTLVVTGGYDHAAGAVGSGNLRPGIVTETTGSALVVNSTVPQATFDPQMRVPCQYHAVKDRYFMSSFSETAGMALKWFRDQFCGEEIALAKEQNRSAFAVIDERIADIPAGSEGLVMLPHLAGAFCPENNPNARGVYFGLSLKHGRAHLARALLEAIAFMLKSHIEVVEELGIKPDRIISMGGGSRSSLWNQIKADVLDRPVFTLQAQEPSLLGAAILAGLGSGIYKDLASASRQMVKIKGQTEPDRKNIAVYQETYDRYVRIYDSLADVFAKR